MKKYEIIEDNGGGITMVVFGESSKVEYLHSGYEYHNGQLSEDIESIKDGGDPVAEWDGNVEDPQAIYDNITAFEHGWEIIADNDGVYQDKMGTEGLRQFRF